MVVRFSRRKPGQPKDAPRRVFAVRLIDLRPTEGDRITEASETARYKEEWIKGLVYQLGEEHRMPEADAARLCLLYGKCIMCDRPLHLKESICRKDPASGLPAAMGRVCYGYAMARAERVAVAA